VISFLGFTIGKGRKGAGLYHMISISGFKPRFEKESKGATE